MAKMKCSEAVRGVKTCRADGKTFKLHTERKGRRPLPPASTRFTSNARIQCDKRADGKFGKHCRWVGNKAAVQRLQIAQQRASVRASGGHPLHG